jgi:flagellar motor protein MotB
MLGFSFAGMLAVVFTAGGCGETLVYKQNKELRDQNRELQAKLDERNALRTESIPLTPPAAPASAVQPPIAQFNEPVAPTPPPITVGPSSPTPPTTDLGGEFTFDDRTGTATVNFMGDALFDSGKATLKDTAKKSLDKMVAALKKQYAGKPVKVNGHSDNDPIRHSKWKSNQELSEARAKAVRDYLVQKGVNASQVSFTGFGETHPKSATDKSKNRRVEIVVMTR